MRRRRRSFGRYYNPKFFFLEKEIDFTSEQIDNNQFLLQEFFTADPETRNKLFNHYAQLYGHRSVAYLERKYSEWSSGNFHLTDLMKERILSIMPDFLTASAKHKLGIHQFMSSIKRTIKSYQNNQKISFRNLRNLNNPGEVFDLFEDEYEKIHALKTLNFRLNVLTSEEKEEALEISKNILEIKLQKIFDQVERDFKTFLPYMDKFKRGNYEAIYVIPSYNLQINLHNKEFEAIEFQRFKVVEIEALSRFKEYSDKYFAYEMISIHKEANLSVTKSFLNENDMQLFLKHYDDLAQSKNEANMNSVFQGEGGVLKLTVQITPLNVLMTSIIFASFKLLLLILLFSSLIILALVNKLFLLLFFGLLFFGALAFGLINNEIEKIKNTFKELKYHGY